MTKIREYPNIMIGTMVKNSAKWLDRYFDVIKSLSYPKKKLRIVVSYGDSTDETLELLKQFKNDKVCNIEVYKEPNDKDLRYGGAQCAGAIYKDWQLLMNDNEDYFMLLDSDIVEVPKNLIQYLLKVKGDVVAPYPWSEGHRHFYDNWIFRINNIRFSPTDPPGYKLTYPIEVDSVGTCFLSSREAWLSVPISNPYPNLTFCNGARFFGYQVVACPYIEIYHLDLEKMNILHNPLPKEVGGYPSDMRWLTSEFPVKEFKKKSKSEFRNNIDIQIANVERNIMNEAMKRYETNPIYKTKSKKWAYNKTYFDTFWCTRNKYLLHLLYSGEIFPSFTEIEISSICKFNCCHCEKPYWHEKPRLMKYNEFKMIIDQFPSLKWMAFTGIGDHWLNPKFLDMLEYVKSKDVYTESYDTFQHFTEESAKKFIELGFERLIVSTDAATKETYEKVRVGHSWDKMVKNVLLLDRLKKEMNSPYFPEINFHFVFDSINQHEALDFLDLVKWFRDEKGVSTGFAQYSRLLHCFDEIKSLYVEVDPNLQSKIQAKAQRYNIPVTWNADIPKELPPLNECTALWMPFFFVTGDVIVCCAQHEQNRRDWERSLTMGNIFETKDFSKIWYGKRYSYVRNCLKNNKLPDACAGCPIQSTKECKVVKYYE